MKKIILILFILLSNLVFADIFDDIRNNDIEAVKKYIQEGGDVNVKNSNGKTLLMIVSDEMNLFPYVNLFLKNGANPNIVDNSGNSSLMFACDTKFYSKKEEEEYKKIIKILLENGASPDMQHFITKDTALMRAAEKNNIDVVKILIDFMANPNIKNSEGETVYDIAVKNGFAKILSVLPNTSKKSVLKSKTINLKNRLLSLLHFPEKYGELIYVYIYIFPPFSIFLIIIYYIWPLFVIFFLVMIIKKLRKNKENKND